MWMGIAAMSVLLPSRQAIPGRVKGRIWGNLAGGAGFCLLYCLLPDSLLPYLGIFGGIGVGLSATYGWQAVFNSLGAMSIMVGTLGLPAWCSSGWATTPWAPYTPGLWTGWPAPPGGCCGAPPAECGAETPPTVG